MNGARRTAILLAALGCCACASKISPTKIDATLAESVAQTRRMIAEKRVIEAKQLVAATERVDPSYPGVGTLSAWLSGVDGASDVFAPQPWGSNRARRIPVERPLSQKVLLYLPDRLFDLVDCVTAEGHLGGGVFADLHATRAVQGTVGARAGAGVGTYGGRSILGARVQTDAGVGFLPVGFQFKGGAVASAGGLRTGSRGIAGMHRPSDALYQDYEDYWSVGGSFTLVPIGATLELHPIQVVDLFAGFVGVDFLRDDFARSRGLDLSREERTLLMELARIERARSSLEAYHSAPPWKVSQASRPGVARAEKRAPARSRRARARAR